MQLYLAAAASDRIGALPPGVALAHADYCIGPESSLLRSRGSPPAKGGLLLLRGQAAPPIADPDALSGALIRECRRQGFGGILLDGEEPPLHALARALAPRLKAQQLTLFAPFPAQGAVRLVGTALSGGDLRQHLLEERAPVWGLDLERLRMDFSLPCPEGVGQPLSPAGFQTLLEREQPTSFFSRSLGAKYFTYLQGGQPHLVLFDDVSTLRWKLRLGAELGACAAFLMWPEIADLAPALFSEA